MAPGDATVEMVSLYVHIPYCRQRCPYCDFNTRAMAPWPEDRYTEALLAELHHAATHRHWEERTLGSVFFGGGTPSLFSPRSLARVLRGARDHFQLAPGAEVTLEANPGTISRQGLEALRAAGVNRLSFGVQSFNDRLLTTLGRIHGGAEGAEVVHLARQSGFDNIGLDLMFAVPGQSLADWIADLDTACRLGPTHISAYSLTYEPGTPFHQRRARGELTPVDEEEETMMFTEAHALLERAGYTHYEISNYARPGAACRHNLTYWHRQPYIGVGAGAHSFTTTPSWGKRTANAGAPDRYMELALSQGHAVTSEEHLTRQQAVTEFLFLGLRVLYGVATDCFERAFGTPAEVERPALSRLINDGLLERAGGRVRLTTAGLLQADSVFVALS